MILGFSTSRRPGPPRSTTVALLFLGLLATGAGPAAASESATPTVVPYGFVRMDGIFDDSRMQNPQYAFWVLSEAEGSRDDAQLTLYPRLSRFGLRVDPFEASPSTKVSGRIEVDFQNGGSESRAALRMRHAFVSIRHGGMEFLAGQTWDLISPRYPLVHADGLLWNAGNLGDRRPQARLTVGTAAAGGEVTAAAALGATNAVDAKDLDKDGVLDGPASGAPDVQGRIGWKKSAGRAFEAGVWGRYAVEETGSPVGRADRFTSWVAGVDLLVALAKQVTLEGEAWTGQDLSDVRGGIGQGVNALTGKEIESKGGWAQVALKPSARWTVAGGGSIDDPRDADVPAAGDGGSVEAGRTRNVAAFAMTAWRPWPAFEAGVEVYRWVTDYRGADRGTDDRVVTHVALFF